MRSWPRSRSLLLTLALVLLGLAGLCFAVAAAHPSDNTYLAMPFFGAAVLLVSVPVWLAVLLPGPSRRYEALTYGGVVVCLLLLVSSVVLLGALSIVPVGLLALLVALGGLCLLFGRSRH